MRRSNKRLRKQKGLHDISMTPLIDVVLTLLIIFMMATPIIQNAIKVTLPRGNAKEDTVQKNYDELIVSVDKQGDFYINSTKVAKADLIAEIKKAIGNDLEKTVYVKADTALSYGTVIELVDEIKCVGGIKYVALATQKHSQKTSPVA